MVSILKAENFKVPNLSLVIQFFTECCCKKNVLTRIFGSVLLQDISQGSVLKCDIPCF